MAGWSMVGTDGCALDGIKTPQKKHISNGGLSDRERASEGPGPKVKQMNELKCWFDYFLKCFLAEVCALDTSVWPLRPMPGNGQSLDLFKLFLVVRERGGCRTVSKNGWWDLVAKDSELDSHLGSYVKSVYTKYLEALETWLATLVDDKSWKSKLSDSGSHVGGILMELGTEFVGFLSDISNSNYMDSKSDLTVSIEVETTGSRKYVVVDDEESMHIDSTKDVADFTEVRKLGNDIVKSTMMDSFSDGHQKHNGVEGDLSSDSGSVKICNKNKGRSLVVEMDGDKKWDHCDSHDVMEMNSQVEELISCQKRKRESTCTMLNWVSGIARNPCDPVVDSLPEISKWKSYGKDKFWKQVLLVRKALFLNRCVDQGTAQSIGQENQKMHPCIYDNHVGSSYNLRDRFRCTKKPHPGKTSSWPQVSLQSSSSASQTDSDSCTEGSWNDDLSAEFSMLDVPVKRQIPLGPCFQAELPEWTGVASERDSKWVGTCVWPLERIENKYIVEREPIGKGRQDSCGCEMPKSIECVRFHCAERRLRMKRELGIAFYSWKFDKMGEEVRLSLTEEEEKKFKAVVRSNPPSLNKRFWDDIVNFFHSKRKEDLVSYYYNVFLLQRRAYQNRYTPRDITSDDDEKSERELVTNDSGHVKINSAGSLLAKKAHKKR